MLPFPCIRSHILLQSCGLTETVQKNKEERDYRIVTTNFISANYVSIFICKINLFFLIKNLGSFEMFLWSLGSNLLAKTKRFYVLMYDKMFKSASTDFIFYCIILFATLQLTAFKKYVALFFKK